MNDTVESEAADKVAKRPRPQQHNPVTSSTIPQDHPVVDRRTQKQQRWEAKQQKQRQLQNKEEHRREWIANNHTFACGVTAEDVPKVKQAIGTYRRGVSSGTIDFELERLCRILEPYVDLQERPGAQKFGADPTAPDEDEEVLFVAEGTETVRLLLQQELSVARFMVPSVSVKSIFVKPSVLLDPPVSLVNEVEQLVPKRVGSFHVVVGTEDVQSLVVGFPISRGALCCGIVPKFYWDEDWLYSYLSKLHSELSKDKGRTPILRVLALDGITDTANLGSMIRSASAFGVHVIVLSPDCCDAWYRRSVRVSMGHIFRVPCVRVRSLAETLTKLRQEPYSIRSYAAVIDLKANLILERMPRGSMDTSWCCIMGNEANGISKEVVSKSDFTLRIDMDEGVDSLSVPVATGILLHGLKEREARENS